MEMDMELETDFAGEETLDLNPRQSALDHEIHTDMTLPSVAD